jgi:hypothetical protein
MSCLIAISASLEVEMLVRMARRPRQHLTQSASLQIVIFHNNHYRNDFSAQAMAGGRSRPGGNLNQEAPPELLIVASPGTQKI